MAVITIRNRAPNHHSVANRVSFIACYHRYQPRYPLPSITAGAVKGVAMKLSTLNKYIIFHTKFYLRSIGNINIGLFNY